MMVGCGREPARAIAWVLILFGSSLLATLSSRAAEPSATQLLTTVLENTQAVQAALQNNQSAGLLKSGLAGFVRDAQRLQAKFAKSSPDAKDVREILDLQRNAHRLQAGLGTAVAPEVRQRWALVCEAADELARRFAGGKEEVEGKDSPLRRQIKATRERMQGFADRLEGTLRGDPWLLLPLGRARQMEVHLGVLEFMAAVDNFEKAAEQFDHLREAYNALGDLVQQRMGNSSPFVRELRAIGQQIATIEQGVRKWQPGQGAAGQAGKGERN